MGEKTSQTRTYTWEDPGSFVQATPSMSGLDMLKAWLRGDLPAPPVASTLGYRLSEVGEGRAVFQLEPAPFHLNPSGVVHGGVLATLVDSAMACAVHSLLPPATGCTTIELKVNYLRPVTPSTGTIRCEAEVLYVGRRVATAQGKVLDGAGRLLAHATTTCMIVEMALDA